MGLYFISPFLNKWFDKCGFPMAGEYVLALLMFSDKKEDLKRSPDLDHVKIGQGQLRLIFKHILFYYIRARWPFYSIDLKQISYLY